MVFDFASCFQFLRSIATDIPVHFQINKNFIAFIQNLQQKYFDPLCKLPLDEKYQHLLIHFTEGILSITQEYLQGHVLEAFTKFYQLLLPKENPFNFTQSDCLKEFSQHPYTKLDINLYRGRILSRDNPMNWYTREQMFHIPFPMRYRVKNERFSISGLPCLYLGASSFVCWEELNRPDYNLFMVSRYHPKHELKIIDISFTPAYIICLYNMNPEKKIKEPNFLQMYLSLLPLIILCSIIDEHDKIALEDLHFRPNYIFSQLLLQFVMTRKDQFDGIRYFSSRIHRKFPNFENPNEVIEYINYEILCVNYVFPIKTEMNSEIPPYCPHLIELFELTDPIAYNLLLLKNPTLLNANYVTSSFYNWVKFILQDDIYLPYKDSLFFKIDSNLSSKSVMFYTLENRC